MWNKINENKRIYNVITVAAFLASAFLFGMAVGTVKKEQESKLETIASMGANAEQLQNHNQQTSVSFNLIQSESQNWGLSFGKEGTTPTGNVTAEELAKYDAYYVGPANPTDIPTAAPTSDSTTDQSTTDQSTTPSPTLYLTFDAGYENGYTKAILDALKKHNAKATFFVVGHYLETAPDLVKRMVEEGHTVGNHTYHHMDMSAIEDKETFKEELQSVNALYKEITGQEMPMYYRPPQGKFSTSNLTLAKELGYHTFFWSLAYVDWIKEDQPTKEEAFGKLLKRVHPGAIVLLHSTSETNAKILDELLTKWEEMGYEFGTLEEIVAP